MEIQKKDTLPVTNMKGENNENMVNKHENTICLQRNVSSKEQRSTSMLVPNVYEEVVDGESHSARERQPDHSIGS